MITVYAYHCAQVDDGLLRALLPTVTAERQTQSARFAHRGDAVRSVCGERLARVLFETRYPGQSADITKESFGKPAIRSHPAFHFNVSHSGDWVVCAVADGPVGVDVEQVTQADLRIADRFFAPEEIELLHRVRDQNRAFYRLWTAKESYIKYLGTGLSMPLSCFVASGERVIAKGSATDAMLHHLALDERYALCACADGLQDARLVIVDNLLA